MNTAPPLGDIDLEPLASRIKVDRFNDGYRDAVNDTPTLPTDPVYIAGYRSGKRYIEAAVLLADLTWNDIEITEARGRCDCCRCRHQ